MKKIVSICILLLCVLSLSAQIRMKVTLTDGAFEQKNGQWTVPADKVESIVFYTVPLNETYTGLEAIDLELPSETKWANYNYTAASEEADGAFYTWAESVPGDNDIVYTNWTVPYLHDSEENRTEWRMPTKADFEELLDETNCTWTWDSSRNGYIVKSVRNSNQIFLPATAMGYYWSTTSYDNELAWALELSSSNKREKREEMTQSYAIRPVWGLPKVTASVTASVTAKTYNTATVKIDVTCSDFDQLTAYGIEGVGVSNEKSSKPNTTNNISLTGLTPSTAYSFKAYVVLNGKKVYSEQVSFTTNAKALNLTSATATADTYSTATVTLNITGDDLSGATYGVRYATTQAGLSNATPVAGTETLSGTSKTVTISLSGLTAETTYYYRAYVTQGSVTKTAADGTFETGRESAFKTPQAVDLGLPSGIKWASFNLGAEKPSDYGGYYGFGDADGDMTSRSSGDYAKGKNFTAIRGNTDYDIAAKQLGGHWRLPSCKEIAELAKCTITWSQLDGVYGWTIVGTNGNSIFIPCAGSWEKTQDENNNEVYNDRTSRTYIWSDSAYNSTSAYYAMIQGTPEISLLARYKGLSIRPVYDDGTSSGSEPIDPTKDLTNEIVAGSDQDSRTGIIPQDGVDMGTSVKWARWNVGVTDKTKTYDYGRYYAWGDTVPDRATYNRDSYMASVREKTSRELGHELPDSIDIAKRLWQGKWRMPTTSEVNALMENCTFKWVVNNGVEGYELTSKTTGNTIFLPAGGYKRDSSLLVVNTRGSYWARSGYNSGTDEQKMWYAKNFTFTSSGEPSSNQDWRYIGMLIRPVMDK